MRRKEKAGLSRIFLLDMPGITQPENKFLPSFFFFSVLLGLGLAGTVSCLLTSFQLDVDGSALVLLGLFATVVCTLAFLLPRWRWPAALALLAVWGFLLWRNFDVVYLGAIRFINAISRAYSAQLNFVLPTLAEPELDWRSARDVQRSVRCLTEFSKYLEFFLCWLLAWLLVNRKSALAIFGVSGLVFLVPMAFSIVPPAWATGLLLLFWSFLLLAASSLRQHRQTVDGKGRFQTSGQAFTRPITLLLLPLLAVAMMLIYVIMPPESYERPKLANEIRDEINSGSNLAAMFRGGTGSGGESVNLNSLGDRDYDGSTVLRVRHSWKEGIPSHEASPNSQKDYLKSFVGSVYTGDSWRKLDSKAVSQALEALDSRRAQTLPASFVKILPVENDLTDLFSVTVQRIDVDPRCVYSPYGLYSPNGAPENMLYADDAFLRTSKLLSAPETYSLFSFALPYTGVDLLDRFETVVREEAEQEIALEAMAGMMDKLEQNKLERETGQKITVSAGDKSTITWKTDQTSSGSNTYVIKGSSAPGEVTVGVVDAATNEFLDKLEGQFEADRAETGDPLLRGKWAIPEWARYQGLETDSDLDLVRRAGDYAQFVYERYTQLPEKTREFLKTYLPEHGLLYGTPGTVPVGETEEQMTTQEYLDLVRDLLARECAYTLTPTPLPGGRDFVEFFLNESKNGYCVHYATAAVAILRSAGIPARYAEGYVSPVRESGTWVDVPDFNAHAWVEVYWSGTGWLPYEVTPPNPDAPAAYANATGPSQYELDMNNEDVILAPMATPRPIPGSSDQPYSPGGAPDLSPEQTEESEPEGGSGVVAAVKGLASYWRFLISLGIAALPFLLILLYRWARRWIRRLLFGRKDRNKAALHVYKHILRLYQANYLLPYWGVTPPEDIEGLALKARFSSHTLTEEELKELTDLAKTLEKRLDDKLVGFNHAKCKYLLALF